MAYRPRAIPGAVATSSNALRGALTTPSPEGALAGSSKGPWRRLFLDASVVEAQGDLTRVFHSLKQHSANPVLKADQPWETGRKASGPYVYGTVMREGGRLRIWCQGLNKGNHVGYAESDDGIRWTKPELGLIDFNGSKKNNLVLSDWQTTDTGGACHNPGVIRNPREAAPDRRYALFGFDKTTGGVRGAYSADGLSWRYDEATLEKGLFRSSDVVNFFWDPYRARYTATWKSRNRRGRAAGIAWSADGRSWSKPVDGPVFGADDLDPDATQICIPTNLRMASCRF